MDKPHCIVCEITGESCELPDITDELFSGIGDDFVSPYLGDVSMDDIQIPFDVFDENLFFELTTHGEDQYSRVSIHEEADITNNEAGYIKHNITNDEIKIDIDPGKRPMPENPTHATVVIAHDEPDGNTNVIRYFMWLLITYVFYLLNVNYNNYLDHI